MNALEKKLLAEKLAGFDSDLGLERASTIPKLWYLDELVYEAEREAVFGDNWLVACRSDEVKQPGEFITTEIAGEPLIVIRDSTDGKLRALSTVCRHRAAKVATAACGVAETLRCHYHGWTYNTRGGLIGLPEFRGVCDFRKEDNGLPQWELDTWGPYVFVRAPGATAKEPLLDFLTPLPTLCADLGLESMKFFGRKEYILDCNWKTYVDNYLDGCYHCNTIHPCLFKAIDYKNYRTVCEHKTVTQISPLKKAEDAEVGSLRKGRDAYYSWVWPNLMVNVYEGIMDTNLVLPMGPKRCRVLIDFFFQHADSAEQKALIEKSMALTDQVQMEDGEICNEVYAGLSSRTFDTGRFSVRRESGGYHFHQLLARTLQTLI